MSLQQLCILALFSFNVPLTWAFPSVPQHQTPLSLNESGEWDIAEEELCPQVRTSFSMTGTRWLEEELDAMYGEERFQRRAIESLGRVIRVPTETYDGLGPVGEDTRWDVFSELHEVLEEAFPQVYSTLKVTKVNTYNLVFHWQGSDSEKLPILITGHQDVVPMDPATVDQWIHPPYSGYFDGTWIWGRGAVDDKASVVAILNAIDSLLKTGFEPRRTVVLAFGINEEASGDEGAAQLSPYLEETYGRAGFAMLLDEGDGYGTVYGGDTIFATPGISEKGYLDAKIEVTTPGGHSSVPPPHTGIGILASAIVAVEANPHPATLIRTGTVFKMLECAAQYGPNVPSELGGLVRAAKYDDDALQELTDTLPSIFPQFGNSLRTTQAVDLVQGGIKVNALPEVAQAVVNHRIAEQSSVAEVYAHLTEVLLPVATSFNLTLDAFGRNVSAGSGVGGHLALSAAWEAHLEPSPRTPTDLSGPWGVLAATIKSSLQRPYPERLVVVSPALEQGNTDTMWYWNLTNHIFRYAHYDQSGVFNGIHTVNEAISGAAFIEMIHFHTKHILYWSDSDL